MAQDTLGSHAIDQQLQQAAQALAQGDHTHTEQLCVQILSVDPDQPEALYLFSQLLSQLGVPEMGLELVQRAVTLVPQEPRYHLGLAELQHLIGDPQAYPSAYQALLYDPGNPKGYQIAAQALADRGEGLAALAHIDLALSLSTAVSAGDQDSPIHAVDPLMLHTLRADILHQLSPQFLPDLYTQIEEQVHYHWNQAQQLHQSSQPWQAYVEYHQVLALRPDHAAAEDGLARLLMTSGFRKEAIAHHHRALFFQPHDSQFLFNLGVSYEQIEELDTAQTCYETAFSHNPNHPLLLISLANLHKKRGDYPAAVQLLSPLLQRQQAEGQVSPEATLTYAAVCQSSQDRRYAIHLLEDCLHRPDLLPDRRKSILFTLGSLQEKLGNYDAAFAAFLQANASHASLRQFDPERHIQWIDQIISTFNTERLSHLPQVELTSDLPIFIVGMPRSGTTLVEQILASHPNVYGGGELKKMSQIISRLSTSSSTPYPVGVERLNSDLASSLSQDYLDHLQSLDPNASRVTDKAPLNFLYLGLIQQLWPQSQIIHCRRDPRDTCLSCFFFNLNQHAYTYDLTHLGIFYGEYHRLMQHWLQVLSIPILEVKYEEMVANPEGISRSMVEFCGLEWDPNCLLFYRNERDPKPASRD